MQSGMSLTLLLSWPRELSRSWGRVEPTKEDAVKKTQADIVRKDKYLQDMIARLEHQLEETEGIISNFHLDNIKEAAKKLVTNCSCIQKFDEYCFQN